ncbi:unnamed protein product [Penicillium roqueforti FM164]|uniref:Genomic scaffold, ProqFM164S01 n=1 Tax=Penicillium roqueforti (strain FM164) TaxID=1365484 RepID=W6Q559_PENRF|nr:unnamed protein product [Penicillium roqueforti FM164]
MAFAKCTGARNSFVFMLALTNAPILLGRRPCDKPLQAKASTRPIYAPPTVLRTNASQTRVVSFLFQVISTYTASTTINDCIVCTPYAPVILVDRTPKINNACVCSPTRRWVLSDPIRPPSSIPEPNDDQSLGTDARIYSHLLD